MYLRWNYFLKSYLYNWLGFIVYESLSQKKPQFWSKLVFSPFFSNPIVHNFADSDWKSKFSLVTAASEAVLLTLFVTITSVYKTHNWLNYEKSTISKSTSWNYDNDNVLFFSLQRKTLSIIIKILAINCEVPSSFHSWNCQNFSVENKYYYFFHFYPTMQKEETWMAMTLKVLRGQRNSRPKFQKKFNKVISFFRIVLEKKLK